MYAGWRVGGVWVVAWAGDYGRCRWRCRSCARAISSWRARKAKEQRRAVKRDAAAVRGAGAGWRQRSRSEAERCERGKGKERDISYV
eukprot:scaffold12582_cov126-Isochrysis_galbana.AAC.6